MKSALRKVPMSSFENLQFDLDKFEVDVLPDDPDQPVCVTLSSKNGQEIKIRLTPPSGDRLGRAIISQCAVALEHWHPSA
jgi:hypothetical protein